MSVCWWCDCERFVKCISTSKATRDRRPANELMTDCKQNERCNFSSRDVRWRCRKIAWRVKFRSNAIVSDDCLASHPMCGQVENSFGIQSPHVDVIKNGNFPQNPSGISCFLAHKLILVCQWMYLYMVTNFIVAFSIHWNWNIIHFHPVHFFFIGRMQKFVCRVPCAVQNINWEWRTENGECLWRMSHLPLSFVNETSKTF